MRRLELLPAVYEQRRRQRRAIAATVAVGVVALALLLGYWLVLGMRIEEAEDDLTRAAARNSELQAEIDSLQRFAQLEAEVNAKEAALATVMTGDVDWPSVLTEVAMLVPGDIWLRNLSASAGQTEGASAVGTETAPVRISDTEPFGRIQFQGVSLTMPGVAKWLVRLGTVKEFEALWLNDATESEFGTTTTVVDFSSTLELNDKAASDRYQDGLEP